MASIKDTFGDKNKFQILADAEKNLMDVLRQHEGIVLETMIDLVVNKGYCPLLTFDSLLVSVVGVDFRTLNKFNNETNPEFEESFPSDSINYTSAWFDPDYLNEDETPAAFVACNVFELNK